MTKHCLGGLLMVCMLVATGQALGADEPAKQSTTGLSFMRTGQLYELCTSKYQNEEAHCEGFIVGVAAMMQNDQLSRPPRQGMYPERYEQPRGDGQGGVVSA